MRSPVKVFGDLPNHYAQTNAAFSPDEQLIFTGTSIEKDSTSGSLLCFFDRKKLELFSRVGISPSLSVVRCLWHPRINQVLVQIYFKFILFISLSFHMFELEKAQIFN
jgi:WD repeat-containing protein 70